MTLCNDGYISPSDGPGTCSHHGGEVGGPGPTPPTADEPIVGVNHCALLGTCKDESPDVYVPPTDYSDEPTTTSSVGTVNEGVPWYTTDAVVPTAIIALLILVALWSTLKKAVKR